LQAKIACPVVINAGSKISVEYLEEMIFRKTPIRNKNKLIKEVSQMKKIFTITMAILLLAAGVYASGWTKHSVTSVAAATSTAVSASPGYLFNVIVRGDKASTCTMNVYDFATNCAFVTTTEIEMVPTIIVTTTEVAWYHTIPLNPPVRFYYGLYHTITSTGEIAVYWLNDNDM